MSKAFKCPFCQKRYIEKRYLYSHMEKEHKEELGDLSAANIYFNFKNKKTHGSCIVCKRETKFNEKTERYDRICSKKCSDLYREEFKKRMQKKYNKTTLLDDPEHQKRMLKNRRISGVYIWSDGTKMDYTGTYEKHALEYLDKTLQLKSNNVICPSPVVIPYTFEGKDHFYIPDFYIESFHLLVEVKGSNNHYQKRDLEKEKAKDKAALDSEYNYVKILDKDYDPLLKIINKIKEL